MAVPYSAELSWNNYLANPNWYTTQQASTVVDQMVVTSGAQAKRALWEIVELVFKQTLKRGLQLLQDSVRLFIKTPARWFYRPFIEKCCWVQYEKTKVNAKLTSYSFVQLASVAPKFIVALAALVVTPLSGKKAKWLQDKSEEWTKNIDGRRSKLEAIKEEGLDNTSKARNYEEFIKYKEWIRNIPSQLCLKV